MSNDNLSNVIPLHSRKKEPVEEITLTFRVNPDTGEVIDSALFIPYELANQPLDHFKRTLEFLQVAESHILTHIAIEEPESEDRLVCVARIYRNGRRTVFWDTHTSMGEPHLAWYRRMFARCMGIIRDG